MTCDPVCTCAPVYLGMIKTGALNWRESCEVHGSHTEWYKNPEQREARQRANDRLIELQRSASEARRTQREAKRNARDRPVNPQ